MHLQPKKTTEPGNVSKDFEDLAKPRSSCAGNSSSTAAVLTMSRTVSAVLQEVVQVCFCE